MNGMGPLVVNIRIEVDPKTDDRLEAWAIREHRSKREHLAWLLELMLDTYDRNRASIYQLAIDREGQGASAA